MTVTIRTPDLRADDERALALLGIPGDVAQRVTQYVHELNNAQARLATERYPHLLDLTEDQRHEAYRHAETNGTGTRLPDGDYVLRDYFDVDPGAKGGGRWVRIVTVQHGRAGSVHSFVEKATGDVYKAAGWTAPAKGVRYRLLDDDSRADMFARLDTYTSYLYAR